MMFKKIHTENKYSKHFDVIQDLSGKDYINTGNSRRRNEGNIQIRSTNSSNNYRVINQKDQKANDTQTNSKNIDHKKYGIRIRHFGVVPPYISHEETTPTPYILFYERK